MYKLVIAMNYGILSKSLIKRCKVCGKEFETTRPMQKVCDYSCALELNLIKQQKEAKKLQNESKKLLREAKDKLKTRGDYAKDAQIAFNAYIRARDNGKPCISCGSYTGKQNAGHYRSVGSCPELRYEESQVYLQCEKCNSYLSGNLINYRINLLKLVGKDKLEWIEGKHEPKKYTISDLIEIKKLYMQKKKDLTS